MSGGAPNLGVTLESQCLAYSSKYPCAETVVLDGA